MPVTDKKNPTPNEMQQIAINTYKQDGRYLIIAGPGTGKTFTVVRRIEAILKDDTVNTNADEILCLTFSDAAAKEMRKKLEDAHLLEASGVNIYTYHSFCLDLMEQHPDVFDIENKSLITVIQKQAIVKKCLDELEDEIKLFRTENSLYGQIDNIVKGIEAIKHNRLTPEAFEYNLEHNIAWEPLLKEFENEDDKNKQQEKVDKMRELLLIYKKYTEKTKDFIDFDDMINKVFDEFENNPKFLEEVSTKYNYILVDEYQDTNKSQNEIVFNLANHCKNIFVVGDDDQIIYTFQGASLDTIEKFKTTFGIEPILLKENRRSTANILKVAEELANLQDDYPTFYVEKNHYKGTRENPIKKEQKEEMKSRIFPLRFMSKGLEAKNEELISKNKPIQINTYRDEKQERLHIINEIESIINDDKLCPKNKNGEKLLSEIAVLTKTNDEAYEYANKLKEYGIKVQLTGGKNIFEINSVKVLVAYLQFISNPEQYPDKLFKCLLSKPFHIHPKDYKILQSREIRDISSTLIKRMENAIIISDTEQNKSEKRNESKILADKAKIKKFLDDYYKLCEYIEGESVKNAVNQIANTTGILKCYVNLEVNRAENYNAIRILLDEADNYTNTHKQATFKDFVGYINTLIEGGIKVSTDKTEKPMNAIQVSTLHSSKGREFEYVFMPNVCSSKYESNTKDDCQEIVPLPETPIKVLNENLNTIERLKDRSRQVKFLNSAKLLYVGITRAKHFLSISCASKRSWFIDKMLENLEKNNRLNLVDIKDNSELNDFDKKNDSYEIELNEAIQKIEQLKEYLKDEYKEEFNCAFEKIKSIKKVLEFTASPDEALFPDYNYDSEFQEYIDTNIPQLHSVSSINTYIDCPKKYFYQYILHLRPLRMEETDEDDIDRDEHYAEWGLIFHHALEHYVLDVVERKEHLPYEILEKYFDEKLNELIENPNKNTVEEKKNHLKECYNILLKTPADNFYEVERSIPDEKLDGLKYIEIADGIKFTGKIDRIDKNSDGTYSIYDYKTGKAKKESDVAVGRNKESIYNQLAFYKYVLETKYNKKVSHAGLLFPEDMENNFNVKTLEDKAGEDNCKTVIDKYIEIIKDKISKNHEFCCKEKCNPNSEYTFCDYKSFCKSKII